MNHMSEANAEPKVTVAPNQKPAFWVYVIELDSDCLADGDRVNLGRCALYVGYTSTSPEMRLAKHQTSSRTAGRVFRRMKDPKQSRLRSDLAIYAGPWPTLEIALRNERRTHNRLVRDGYRVFGNRGRKFMARRPGVIR